MKKGLKKGLLLIIAVMALSVCFVFGVSALEESGSLGDGITYTYDSSTGKVVISGEGGTDSYRSWQESPFYRSDVKSVVIEEGIKRIGNYVFYDCDSLTSIAFPDVFVSIGEYAFYGCDTLTNVTIPDGVRGIGDYAFYSCDSLTGVTIPKSVLSIGERAFDYYIVAEGNENYSSDEYGVLFSEDKSALVEFPYNDSAVEYAIPDSVTHILDSAFEDCDSLTSVTFPDGLVSIGGRAFYDCDSLTSVNIPDSVTKIDYRAFDGCDSLISAKIGNGVTRIERNAFINCDNLSSLTIGDSVSVIGEYAFQGCESLTNVIIPDSVTIIGENAFAWCGLTSVKIPDSVRGIGVGAFTCSGLTDIYVDVNNEYYSNDEHGVLFDKNKTKLIQAPKACEETAYIIPDSVTSIGDEAFYDCDNLASIKLPVGLKSIGYRAFCSCDSLTSVTFPDGVLDIGDYAFYNCKSLTSVTIPRSVTTIGTAAFFAYKNLSDVYYMGSEEQWKALNILSGNEALLNANVHFAIEGHIFGDWYRENEPTCTKEGNDRRDCLYCPEYETSIVSATGHSYGRWYKEKEPICEEEGNDRRDCLNCSAYETNPLAALGHKIEYAVIESTCTEKGEEVIYCTECNYEKRIDIDKVPHSDNNADGNCDSCGENIARVNCSCNCHKGGLAGFIWMILRIFYKLFKSNQFCACGIAHY